jgi:lipopolysaccharide/colanic/teichoic acid biosynthesis glycosyltransferase
MMRAKRAVDIVLAVLLLVVLSPLLALLAIGVRLCAGSPVLFRQMRPGLLGRPFILYKFRTMADERDHKGDLLPDEQRLTRLGSLLRGSSLDELPELLNVVRGDMSFVGPRPLLMQYLDRYTPEQMRRHEVLPGITGWAQIHGRNTITWEKKFALDVWYVDHQSMRLDLKIMTLTVWKILTREGISEPGQATMSEFMGSSDRS